MISNTLTPPHFGRLYKIYESDKADSLPRGFSVATHIFLLEPISKTADKKQASVTVTAVPNVGRNATPVKQATLNLTEQAHTTTGSWEGANLEGTSKVVFDAAKLLDMKA